MINEGESVQLAVAYTFDGRASVLRVDWGDGSSPTTLSIAAQSSNVIASHIYRDDDPSVTAADVYDIQVTLTDSSGDTDSAVAQVTVRNVAPTIGSLVSDATFASPAAEGKTINILTSFADPGVRDTHIASINWGDGSTSPGSVVFLATGLGSVTGNHVYDAGGIYTITLTLDDDDHGVAIATTTAVVTGVGLNHGTLYIVGSRNDDDARVHQTGSGRLTVRADFIRDKSRTFDAAAVARIIAYLGDGDDRFDIAENIEIPVVAHGGAGDDRLEAGRGPSVLLGDEGNDLLGGRGGRNILIGGTGYDSLFGGSNGDVLIGGRTASDQNDMALLDVLAAWNASSAYAARVALINALLTVVDDRDRDRLKGGAKLDLFYDGEFDILADVKNDEIVVR